MLERARRLLVSLPVLIALAAALPASAQRSFVAFESGHVRPLALDGTLLYVVNTPDNHLEIFQTSLSGLTRIGSVQVGMEPVSVAVAVSQNEVWVVNHLSDSVSIVDVSVPAAPKVTRTLLVGDEPRDIVFAQARAFITTAHRGQHRTHASISGVTGAGDPQLTTAGVSRADIWVFDAASPGAGFGGTPLEIIELFGDTPRALATDGSTVYAAIFHSGNQTAVVSEGIVCDGFGAAPCAGDGVTSPNGLGGGNLPGGNPGPSTNHEILDAPEVGLVVQYDNTSGEWRDEGGRNWSNGIRFTLPDLDVFAIDATTLNETANFDHVGTILFNMAVNPVNGNLYVTNVESPNLTRFEGPGTFGLSPTTVQGHLSEARITVIEPGSGTMDARHLNKHIDYGVLPAPAGVKDHSLATPMMMAISSDGAKLYVAAFGSNKIGVFDTADLDNDASWNLLDPTTESANYLSLAYGGPSGIVLDEFWNRLYVTTRFNNGVSIIHLSTGSEKTNIPLHNPEPEEVVTGRPMLYDAFKTSSNGEASCSSCHIFGDFDSLSWDLGDPDGNVSQSPIPIKLGSAAEAQEPDINGTGNVEDFHPMKGPMTTQTLRGLATHGHMHWRGDRVVGFFPSLDPVGDEKVSFKNFIVAMVGLVGGDTPPTDPALQDDMDDFADFMLEVFLPPNPVLDLANSLNGNELAGLLFFLGLDGPSSGGPGGLHGSDGAPFFQSPPLGFTCEGCHTLDPANGHFGGDGEQSFENEPQIVKIPHFRNLYQKVGMFGMPNVDFNTPGNNSHQGDQVRGTGFLHDGSTDTIFRFLTAVVFENAELVPGFPVGFAAGAAGDTQRENVEQFMLAFGGDLAPIVGQQVSLDGAPDADSLSRIVLMEARANANFDSLMLGGTVKECDLIVKGTVGGIERGYLFDPGTSLYESDRVAEGTLTSLQMRDLALVAGQEITYTCAPPGSGTRMGIDRDEDGFLDRDEIDFGTDPANGAAFFGACNDGQDNDGDSLIDLADPGCGAANWHIENPACNDGWDNDGDGKIDLLDVQCTSASLKIENFTPGGTKKSCAVGPELLVLLPLFWAVRARRQRLGNRGA